MLNEDKNLLVILSSPSGVGKTTLTKKIQQKYSSFKTSLLGGKIKKVINL